MRKIDTPVLTLKVNEKNLSKSKRSEMQLSFGMIFSIILIVAFLAFGFYAIRGFLGVQDAAKIGQFRDKLQDDVNDAWRASQASQELTYTLPDKVKEICFIDEEQYGQNLVLKPNEAADGVSPILIENINISAITRGNEYCVDVVDGKLELMVGKEFGENLVLVTRV